MMWRVGVGMTAFNDFHFDWCRVFEADEYIASAEFETNLGLVSQTHTEKIATAYVEYPDRGGYIVNTVYTRFSSDPGKTSKHDAKMELRP